MVDVFNLVSKGVIFQEIHVAGVDIIQLIPFVHAFYAFKSLLFYSHHNHESDVTIIPFAMGIPQGDPVGGGGGGGIIHFNPFLGFTFYIYSFPFSFISIHCI
jgi:hypothetical protein